jgi:hypothetical protein
MLDVVVVRGDTGGVIVVKANVGRDINKMPASATSNQLEGLELNNEEE